MSFCLFGIWFGDIVIYFLVLCILTRVLFNYYQECYQLRRRKCRYLVNLQCNIYICIFLFSMLALSGQNSNRWSRYTYNKRDSITIYTILVTFSLSWATLSALLSKNLSLPSSVKSCTTLKKYNIYQHIHISASLYTVNKINKTCNTCTINIKI